ncbi:MAG: UDP-3-O-(3-hydroxymyristoyl)glucosamine N-acyltransferase [Planctomycetales bacterium]|nr:UDP-3-O-(3-hydroxymyristoyl)glucosamine N-acyltransferase [Planctomycetales bacterium]
MPTTLGQLANLVGGSLRGDASLEIVGAATLDVANVGELAFVDHPDRAKALAASSASAALVTPSIPDVGKPAIVVDDVHASFAEIVRFFRPQRVVSRRGICAGSHISKSASLGTDVEIHPGASIGEDVVIGDRVTIHAGVHIMADCTIGDDTTLFPNVVLYENTQVGRRCLIHAGAVLGAYGFGYRQQDGRHELSAQLGNVVICDEVEIGASATVDRGTYGPTVIGEGTKVDNLVMIAHNCRIGRHNLICSQVGIAGSTTTGDYVVMAGQVGVRDHVHIGTGAVLCSKSGISNDIPDGEVVLGQPATPLRQQKVQMAALSKLPDMRRQFRQLQRQFEELLAQSPTSDADDDSREQAA